MTGNTFDTYERFYRYLLVQNILQQVRRHSEKVTFIPRGQQETNRTPPKRNRTKWQIFLDSLSVLCDHEKGGETVAAIAAEDPQLMVVNVTFWIAVNQRNSDSLTARSARDHLLYLVQSLQRIARHEDAVERVLPDIFYASVSKAKNRVNNYRKKLQSLLASAKQGLSSSSSSEAHLVTVIDSLIEENKTVESLCKIISNFRLTEDARTLVRIAKRDHTGRWKYICHFIGRLGAWFKAARFLCDHACEYGDILSNSSVELVPFEDCVGYTPSPITDLDGLLSQTHFDLSKDRLEHVFGPGAFAAGCAQLTKCQERGWRLKAHAEASMARFFAMGNRRFVKGERYIGCSKPSCMCCELYMELLPRAFERRPCHGNAWTQWCFPGASLQVDAEQITIVKRMTDRLQRHLEIEIMSGLKGHVATHDSSTDMSSVFARMSVLR